MRLLGAGLAAGGVALFAAFVLLVPQWRAPGRGADLGPPGQAMVQFEPARAERASTNTPMPKLPAVADDPRPATAAYRNVTVLTELNAGDFMRVQHAMTAWVAPKSGADQGCGFCHAGTDYASDAKPEKAVARRMLAMTRTVNADWKGHVGEAGVTCFTCHRGRPVPSDVWFQTPPRVQPARVGKQDDWVESSRTVKGFFPTEGYEEYLLQTTPARGVSRTALPVKGPPSPLEVKRLYEAMMQMSEGMGVNCGYCHHSRAFQDWRQSTPMRWTGESGIDLTRVVNRTYLLEVHRILPQDRRMPGSPRDLSLPARDHGPQNGNAFAECGTCHHGAPKALPGSRLAAGVPGLVAPAPRIAALAAPTAAR